MRSKRGQKTRNVHQSIDLCSPPEDLMLQLQWYHETRPGSGRYLPSARTKNVDRQFVHVSACLGLVKMKHNDRNECVLVGDEQLPRFTRLMDSIN